MRRKQAGEHIRALGRHHGPHVRDLTSEDRQERVAKIDKSRVEHRAHRTEPERTRAGDLARYGDPRGHTDEFLDGVARMFVEEFGERPVGRVPAAGGQYGSRMAHGSVSGDVGGEAGEVGVDRVESCPGGTSAR